MKAQVIARLTVEREVGARTIIEVHADASFAGFYRYFTQDGRRRSTKREVRQANRNEGLRPYASAAWIQPGLEVLAESFRQMKHVKAVRVRIIRKRAYRKLLEAAPDTLGLVKVPAFTDVRLMPKPVLRYPVRIPSNHTTIAKRVSILTGRR